MAQRILFLGFGNMGQAIAGGLLQQEGQYHIEAVDPYFAKEGSPISGVSVHAGAEDVESTFDMVVLAVKPQMAQDVYPLLQGLLREGAVVLSIMAGVLRETIVQHVPESAYVVRAMPNTPAAIGLGMSVLVADETCPAECKGFCGAVLKAVGQVAWVDDEELMHAVTAVSGSGPAYFFALMDAMIKAGTALGLDIDLAEKLAVQTAYGAGALAALQTENVKSPLQLREAVTSKGGTTEAALAVLAEKQLDSIVFQALEMAKKRSIELAG